MTTSFPAIAKPQPDLWQSKYNGTEAASKGLKGYRFRPWGGYRGAPGNRESLAVRSACVNKGNLMAVMPTTNMGVGVAANPTLFFYIPETSATQAEFTLYEGEINDGPEVYKKTLKLSKTSGIMSLSLPNNGNKPPLEVNKQYHWALKLVCDSEESAGDPTVDGGIQRVALNSTLKSKLQKAAPRDRLSLYAQEGLWNDLLKSLADLRSANPRDASLAADWTDLLKSEGLDLIAGENLIPCCKPEENSSR